MASFTAKSRILLAGTALMLLASCGGADDVASPGAGSVVIVNPTPAPTPTPTTPTPTPITAAQFAAATTQNNVTITVDEQLALVNAGQNNNVNGSASALSGLLVASGASLGTATNPQTINAGFQATNFIGAINGPTDTSFQGWTCNSPSADFGTASQSCYAVPAIGTLAAGQACPAGTNTPSGSGAGNAATIGGFKVCDIPQQVTTSLTLPRIQGVVYRFTGQTEVGNEAGTSNAVLTIEPGVTVFANYSESTNDLILVNRGARIQAVGTAANPIIFTAQQNLTANSVSDSTQGFWGGVILLGRAPIGVCGGSGVVNNAEGSNPNCTNQIEGVTGRLYGGTNAADNSGTMQYVQIRFSGIAISEGNELQGLTLGGTGSGTTIDHVQSHNSADDGIEIFGGTTNIRYFAVTGADDDSYDIDFGYRGTMQFIIAAQRVGGATADSFVTEIDSNGNEDLLPRTYARYANFTFFQTAGAPAALRLRGGADGQFVNGIIRSTVPCVNIVAGAGTGADRSTIRAANAALQDAGAPTFNSVYFACSNR